MQKFAPILLRYTLVFVFLWFGLNQWQVPSHWTSFVPNSVIALTHLSALTLISINSLFEIISALLLLLGIYIRPVALLLGLHLFGIAFSLGLSAVGVRDFGLSFATLALFLYGADHWSWDWQPEVSPTA